MYIGVKAYTVKDETKEAKAVWPAIVDAATFAHANKRLDSNKGRYKPYKEGKFPYLLSGIMFCEKCQNHMPGKSATGRNGKVGYYEHSWATKRDSTLSKKIFRCEPHRIPSRIIEPLVWQEVVKFVTKRDFIEAIHKKVKALHEEIEAAPDSLKIHFIVDKNHYRAEKTLGAALSATPNSNSLFLKNSGSNTLTIGAP
jgi:Recombinase zinc beta ribbon domain